MEGTTSLGGILAGGILSQLIEFKRDQVGDCEACLEWYATRKEVYQKQLDDLLALQQMIENSQGTDDETE